MDNSSNTSKTGHMIDAWHKAGRVALIILYLVVVIIILAVYDATKLQALRDQHQKLAFVIILLAVLITGLDTTFSSLIQYQLGKQVGEVLNFADGEPDCLSNLASCRLLPLGFY